MNIFMMRSVRFFIDPFSHDVNLFVTPVYCGSLASVRSPKPACPYRVPASSPTSLRCSFFEGSSLQASSWERVPILDCFLQERSRRCRSKLWVGLLGSLFSPHASFPTVVLLTRDVTARPELGICAGRVTVESQAPLKVSGQRLPVRVSLIFRLAVGFSVGVRMVRWSFWVCAR